MSDNPGSDMEQLAEVRFAWRGRAGRTTTVLAVAIVESTHMEQQDAFVVEVRGFKQCYYVPADGSLAPAAPIKSMRDLPDDVQAEIKALLGSTCTVPRAVVDSGAISYIPNPRPE